MTRAELRKHFQYRKDGALIALAASSNRKKGAILYGTPHASGYLLTCFKGRMQRHHKMVWILNHGAIRRGFELDHINRNKKDNRIENLRLCTKSQNAFNTVRCGSSGKKGLHYDRNKKLWVGKIQSRGQIFVKYSVKKTVALAWLDAKRKELHGPFARA